MINKKRQQLKYEKIKLNNQESFTKIIDDYNKEKKSKSKSIIDININ